MHPAESSGIVINLSVLGVAVILEFYVLFKAMKEVIHETGTDAKGMQIFTKSFGALGDAKPATKLVFMEDLVATLGGIIAIVGILLSYYAGLNAAEGIASIIIGVMMFYVVARVFLDNAKGVLGEADDELEQGIAKFVFKNPEIRDIKTLFAMKEGEDYHIEMKLEIDSTLTVKQATEIKNRIEEKIQQIKGVTDVIIEFDVDDEIDTFDRNTLLEP